MIKKYPILKKTLPLFFLLFSVVAFSQITQRGTAITSTSTNASLTISKPTGIAVGDLMLANIAQGSDDRDIYPLNIEPTSSGWNKIGSIYLDGRADRRGSVFYKIAVASDVTAINYTFALDADNDSAVGAIIAFYGVDSSNPFDVIPGTINTTKSVTVSATSITTVTANAAIVMLGQAAGGNRTWSGWTTTSPGSLTELFDAQNGAGKETTVGGAWEIKPAVGATGNGRVTLSGEERNGGILLALRPYIGAPISPITFTSSGTFTVPSCVSSVTIQAWGGGASGNVREDKESGGGGGGGYITNTYSVTSGQTISIVVGAGGIPDTSTNTGSRGANGTASSYNYNASGNVTAGGGMVNTIDRKDGGVGGAISGLYGAGSIKGGNGGNGNNNKGGGGGGSGPGSTNASGQTGGNPGGGNGGNDKQSGVNGTTPGGGGGGRGDEGLNTGSGANGQVIISWTQPSINTWNGSVSTDWNNASNWCTGVPSVANNLDVVIPSALATTYSPTLSIGDFGYVENILFESGSILTVEDNYLFVKTNLTLNGKIDLNNGAQLVQDTGCIFDAASTGTIEIDQQGTSDNFKYNYWGSPVNITGTAYTIEGVLRDGTDPNALPLTTITFGTPYAFADVAVTSPIRLSTYWMYKYANLGNGYSGWTSVGKAGNLNVGEGFTMKGSNTNLSEQNYTFVGKPNNGDINLTISANNEYLIGNPYPSAIDAKEFIRDNISAPSGYRTVDVIDGNLYFWDHFGGGNHLLKSYEGGYAIYNLSGSVVAVSNDVLTKNTGATSTSGKVPQRFIPVAQGFFVSAVPNIIATENIQFKNSQRVFKTENASVSQFMKSAKISKAAKETDEDTFPRIHLNYSSPKGYQRQLLVAFIENTTDGVDIGYDAINYETFAEDMSWRTNNINFIIQAVPTLNNERVLPLEVKVATAGIVKISIDKAENIPDGTEIFIKDINIGDIHNISKKSFEIELPAGKYTDRFALIFKTQKLVAEDVKAEILIPATTQSIIEGIHVFMNNALGELQIKNNSTEEIVSVALINSLGQTVKAWNSNLNIRTISLPISTATGVYLVQINTKTGKTVKKISVE